MVTGPSLSAPCAYTSQEQHLPPGGRKGHLLTPPSQISVRFGGARCPRGAPSSGAVPGCPHVRVPHAGGSRGGRLQVRAGSGF